MQMTEDGISVTKAELAALLEFCEKDEKSNLCNVRFTAERDRLSAYATDGHRAVEADAPGILGHDGEWAIERGFLELVKKTLSAEQRAILLVSGASLRDVRIEEEQEGSGEWKEASSLSWPRDAACSQMTIAELRKVIKLPSRIGDVAKCVTVSAHYIGAIALVGKAADEISCDIYVRTRSDPVTFQVQSVDGTTWTGVIMPRLAKDEKPEPGPERTEAEVD